MGIVVNKHGYARAASFEFFGKKIPKTKIVYDNLPNSDMLVCAGFDGMPKVKKSLFALPEESQKVYLIDQRGNTCPGLNQKVDEQGTCKLQARATYSSEEGDCGGPVINANGSVVGFHFSAGNPKKDNLYMPVDPTFLALVPKN
jgi:hypothetical protein